ncbi:hypothetical protein [Flavobacterium sp.]|uniref:hypothetical protein n=1 Tax=Flavobacterium sp. TaxID=239 RepID=UPI0038FC5A19
MNLDKNKTINEYSPSEQLEILRIIGNQIYIARHISLNEQTILDHLKNIDILFKEQKETWS